MIASKNCAIIIDFMFYSFKYNLETSLDNAYQKINNDTSSEIISKRARLEFSNFIDLLGKCMD